LFRSNKNGTLQEGAIFRTRTSDYAAWLAFYLMRSYPKYKGDTGGEKLGVPYTQKGTNLSDLHHLECSREIPIPIFSRSFFTPDTELHSRQYLLPRLSVHLEHRFTSAGPTSKRSSECSSVFRVE
jgi:hypothetical protein